MAYVRVTVQMTDEEVAVMDQAIRFLMGKELGRRASRADILRTGALRYARELLAGATLEHAFELQEAEQKEPERTP